MPTIREYDIGCEPSPSVPAETLIQDGSSAFLLFFAVSKNKDESGYLRDLRVAVVECKDCLATKFGYPNDEGLPEHPLYAFGLGELQTRTVEVVGSPWVDEVASWIKASVNRIWGERRGIPAEPSKGGDPRHFMVLLKERTFECVASGLEVVQYAETFDDAIRHVIDRQREH
jgi:hypothetical protein